VADLPYIDATLEVKIAGQDSTGDNVNYVSADANGNMLVKDYSDGPVSPGTAAASSLLIGGQYNSTPPTLTNTQQVALQVDAAGRLLVDSAVTFPYDTNYGTVGATTLRTASEIGNATGAANFNAGATGAQTLRVTANLSDGSGNSISSTSGALNVYATQGTSPWITKDQSDGPVTPGTVASFSQLLGGQYNSTLPTLTTGQQAAVQVDSSGRLLVDISNATIAVTQSGTWTVQQGSAPWSFVGNLTNNNAAPAATNIGALIALAEGTVNASRYTTGDQVLLVTDLAGNTNVDLQYYLGSAVSKTNPIATTISDGTNVITAAISAYGTAPTGTEVMGVNAFITNTPTVNQGTSPWIVKDQSDGPVAPGTVASFSMLVGGQFNTTLPTLTNTQQAALQVDSSGRLIISPTTGAAITGAVTTAPPTYTTGTSNALSLTIDGDLRTADIVNTNGQNRAQSVTTTAAEALGAATILANRKMLSITPTDGTIYWGYSNAVTTTTGSPIFKNQTMTFAVGANVHIYVIAGSTTDARIMEGS